MTSYVSINIVNNTQLNSTGSGLADDQIYLFFTQESVNTAWSIDNTTGIATPISPPGTLPANPFTLADLKTAGGAIKIDSSVQVPSARIYLSSDTNVVTAPNGVISGPTAGIAQFYYDFFEFALTTPGPPGSPPNSINIDTTQVDQLGIPLTLQVTPNDPNFPSGSGIIATLDRQTLLADFKAMATGALAPFADCIFPTGSQANTPYRLLNPSDVIGSQLQATGLDGTLTTSGTPGKWQATFEITGPGIKPPTNGALKVGMNVSGPLIPAGITIASLPGSPDGYTVVMISSDSTNPFTRTNTPVELFFFNPVKTELGTYFDTAIDDFFTYYKIHQNALPIEQNHNGNIVYVGNVVQLRDIVDINGNPNTYTVLQFTGNGEVYNIFYPFFSTNSPAGKQTPFGEDVPPPPTWWASGQGLMFFAPPSLMVFGASGVFADNTQQPLPANCSAAVLGAIENVVVTALARGYATDWPYKYGTIIPNNPPTTATVDLSKDYDSSGLINQSYMSSFQIANIPMTITIPSGKPVGSFQVSSPLSILPTQPDLLSFGQFYPSGGTWSAFANFLHNGAGCAITIDGRAYALPFDDQGGFSSDLNAATSVAAPVSVLITMGPWS
jgi:hypothetical protein